MSLNPAKTLEILFALEPEAINHDLRRAEDNIDAITTEITSLLAHPPAAVTPEQDARLTHLILVEAHDLCRLDGFPPELKTYAAAASAERVSERAEAVASHKDTLAELAARMMAICRREGLTSTEPWVLDGNGPPEFQKLIYEFLRILARISMTVFTSTLRRYHMDEQADLFECDPKEFNIQHEIGRRVMSPMRKKDAEQFMQDFFRTRYGEAVSQRVQSRVKELRAHCPGP